MVWYRWILTDKQRERKKASILKEARHLNRVQSAAILVGHYQEIKAGTSKLPRATRRQIVKHFKKKGL